jgi:hypothetical protein
VLDQVSVSLKDVIFEESYCILSKGNWILLLDLFSYFLLKFYLKDSILPFLFLLYKSVSTDWLKGFCNPPILHVSKEVEVQIGKELVEGSCYPPNSTT